MAPSSAASSLLIKGFLPVRLKLPGCNHFLQNISSSESDDDGLDQKEKEEEEDETFFFVKPHVVNNNTNNTDSAAAASTTAAATASSSSSSKALFVVNVPTVSGIRTKVLLKSLLGRFGDVERVTVVENPRKATKNNNNNQLLLPMASSSSSIYNPVVVVPSAWSKPLSYYPSCLAPMLSEGKFAHVEFTSTKEMKRAMKVLKEIMSSEPVQQDDDDDDDDDNAEHDNNKKNNSKSCYPALRLEKLEIQTLMDETQRQYLQSEQNATSDNDDDYDKDDDDKGDVDASSKPPLTGILAVAERYRASLRRVPSARSAMLKECNAVMASFEEAEEAHQGAREAAAHTPDDDGFVTVTYTNNTAGANDLEMAKMGRRRRRGDNQQQQQQRHRKKKESTGASQLDDFYRFQRKENRKRDLQDLRQKFEEDLARVKRMKEDQQYRPFR